MESDFAQGLALTHRVAVFKELVISPVYKLFNSSIDSCLLLIQLIDADGAVEARHQKAKLEGMGTFEP